MKTCTKCKIEKDISEFYTNKAYKDGLTSWCKMCTNEHNKNYNLKHKDYYSLHYKNYRENNKTILSTKAKTYFIKNKDKILNRCKIYRLNNKNKIRLYHKNYNSNKRKTNSNFKLIDNLRRRINSSIKRNAKSSRSMNLIGCDIDFLKAWLNITALANSYKNFDINNYSGQEYHIDHKIPCASFDLSKEEEQKKCFNWLNLQILTKEKNLIKADKIGDPVEKLFS